MNPVLGQWTDGDSGLAVEFKHNGTIAETLPSGAIGEGSWAFIDDTHIRVEPAGDLIPSGAYIATVVIIGNQMQFFTLTGDILKSFTRSVLPSPTPSESPPPSPTPSPTETPLPTSTPSPTI